MDFAPITSVIISAMALVITTVVGLLIPKLPLLFSGLQVYINGVDATLLNRALDNVAEKAIEQVQNGTPIETAVAGMVEYVWNAMPKVLTRLQVSRSTLETMANGTLARLMVQRG